MKNLLTMLKMVTTPVADKSATLHSTHLVITSFVRLRRGDVTGHLLVYVPVFTMAVNVLLCDRHSTTKFSVV